MTVERDVEPPRRMHCVYGLTGRMTALPVIPITTAVNVPTGSGGRFDGTKRRTDIQEDDCGKATAIDRG
jgi:hypothetical protein